MKPPSTLVADDAVAVTPVDCAPSLAAALGVTSEWLAALSSTQSTRSASELLESSRRRPKYDLSVTMTPAPMPPCAAVHCSSGIGWPAVVAASGTEFAQELQQLLLLETIVGAGDPKSTQARLELGGAEPRRAREAAEGGGE